MGVLKTFSFLFSPFLAFFQSRNRHIISKHQRPSQFCWSWGVIWWPRWRNQNDCGKGTGGSSSSVEFSFSLPRRGIFSFRLRVLRNSKMMGEMKGIQWQVIQMIFFLYSNRVAKKIWKCQKEKLFKLYSSDYKYSKLAITMCFISLDLLFEMIWRKWLWSNFILQNISRINVKLLKRLTFHYFAVSYFVK